MLGSTSDLLTKSAIFSGLIYRSLSIFLLSVEVYIGGYFPKLLSSRAFAVDVFFLLSSSRAAFDFKLGRGL